MVDVLDAVIAGHPLDFEDGSGHNGSFFCKTNKVLIGSHSFYIVFLQ
jgi:hypothetical protein